ncbi:MAG: hypothetical protein HC911_17695 [Chloroflexaceae bacterium]|nr:hypothetical protein [Chloroflexaceae bacterium]
MTIVLIDTSIFCNVLNIPNRNQRQAAVQQKLEEYLEANFTLLLPLATIIETGNHIAQQPDSFRVAKRFVEEVRKALAGESPFVTTPALDQATLANLLNDFPDFAKRGIGLGDCAIIAEFDRQCQLHPHQHILIWSLDHHLSSYDR